MVPSIHSRDTPVALSPLALSITEVGATICLYDYLSVAPITDLSDICFYFILESRASLSERRESLLRALFCFLSLSLMPADLSLYRIRWMLAHRL